MNLLRCQTNHFKSQQVHSNIAQQDIEQLPFIKTDEFLKFFFFNPMNYRLLISYRSARESSLLPCCLCRSPAPRRRSDRPSGLAEGTGATHALDLEAWRKISLHPRRARS